MNEEFLMGAPKKELNIDNYEEEEEEDEDESIMESMNEDHRGSLQTTNYNNDYNLGYSSSSIKNDSKKNASGKRLKPDDEEEDVKIDTYIQRDVKSISVKDMRKLVPKLRIECFYTEQELSGKKKMKHLWDQRPPNWPADVPFKDPNNPGKEGSTKKPGKSDLMKMYTYLRDIYLKNKGLPCGSSMHSPAVPGPQQLQHVYQQESPQTCYQQQQQTYSTHRLHQQHNLQQHFGQLHQQLTYQPSDDVMSVLKIAQPESMDEGQLIPSQIDPTLSGRTTNMSCTPSPTSNVSNGNVCQEVVKEEPFIISTVVEDLYKRIEMKVEAVTRLQGVTDAVRNQLFQVIEDVLNPIYNGLTNTSFCLMYLDAGHQMEALLDCMIVLKKVEPNLLSSGCSEIKKKFQNLDIWHCCSFISRSLPFIESNQGCVTDCIKFRSKDHHNVSIPIDQRKPGLESICEQNKLGKKFAMCEINRQTDLDFSNVLKLNMIDQLFDDINLLNDFSGIGEIDIDEYRNYMEDGANFVNDENYDFQPELMPTSQSDPNLSGLVYQASSFPLPGSNDELLLNSDNPLLSSSCSPLGSDTNYMGSGSMGGGSLGHQIYQEAGLLQCGGNSMGSMLPYSNSNNRIGFSSLANDFRPDCGLGGNSFAPIIPKSVEDMDCSDDNGGSKQKISRPTKRRKK